MARYIDADKLINDYTDIFTEYGIELAEQFQGVINQSPTEEVAPVIHAEWIIEIWNNKEHYTCSNCNHVINFEPCYHYCPMCGAKMIGVKL